MFSNLNEIVLFFFSLHLAFVSQLAIEGVIGPEGGRAFIFVNILFVTNVSGLPSNANHNRWLGLTITLIG